MKKIVAAILILFSLTSLVAGGFFLIDLKSQNSDSDPQGRDISPAQIKSFRGVLAETLTDIANDASKIKKEIVEAVSNPFAINNAPGNKDSGAPEGNFTFAVVGDTQSFDAGNPRGNFQKAVKSTSGKKPDLVLATGDLVSTGNNYSEYSRKFADWRKIMSPLLSKTYAAMGNHDNVGGKGEKAWQDAFDLPLNGPAGYSETVYSFDFKNSHFVFLNSDKEKEHLIDGNQRAWLEQDLTKNRKENTFVIFHEPAYPVSDKRTESLDADPPDRNALWEILEKHNVTAVFNGHEHIVSRRKIGQIYQFVFGNTDSFNHGLPAAGIAEYSNQGQGRSGIVKVNGKEITVEVYDPNGKLLNNFTFSK